MHKLPYVCLDGLGDDPILERGAPEPRRVEAVGPDVEFHGGTSPTG